MTPLANISPLRGLGVQWLALLTLSAVAACALPAPPTMSAQHLTSKTDDAPAPWRPTVEILEGQPRGLLLAIGLPGDMPADVTEVALLRQVIDPSEDIETEFRVHYTFTPSDQTPLWRDGQARFLDEGLSPGTRYRYAVAADTTTTTLSTITAVTWEAPPSPPQALQAESVGAHTVISWDSVPGQSAVVFRRQVGSRRYTRLSPIADIDDDFFLDTGAAPGKLYGYRVSSAIITASGTAILGPPSTEVFVRTMDQVPDP